MSLRHKELLSIPHYRVLSIVAFATLLSSLAWLIVIFNLDPYESTGLGLSLFFLSLFFALSGGFSIILFFLKKWKSKNEIYLKHVSISLRQGILLSICTCSCLLLLMLGLLRIWNGLLIVFIIMFIEFYLSGKDELN